MKTAYREITRSDDKPCRKSLNLSPVFPAATNDRDLVLTRGTSPDADTFTKSNTFTQADTFTKANTFKKLKVTFKLHITHTKA